MGHGLQELLEQLTWGAFAHADAVVDTRSTYDQWAISRLDPTRLPTPPIHTAPCLCFRGQRLRDEPPRVTRGSYVSAPCSSRDKALGGGLVGQKLVHKSREFAGPLDLRPVTTVAEHVKISIRERP